MHRYVMILAFLAATASHLPAITVTSTVVGTVFSKAAGGADYGPYGYIYAPAAIQAGFNRTLLWHCGGVVTPDGFTGQDHVFFSDNFGPTSVVLCPSNENARTPNPLCNGQYPPVTDPSGQPLYDYKDVCDPTVLNLGGQYFNYYTADPGGIFLALSSDGVHWTKYPDNTQPAQPIIPSVGVFVGEATAVFKSPYVWLYYTYFPYFTNNTVYVAQSLDAVNFSGQRRIFPQATLPFAGEGTGGIDVKYFGAHDLWFMVTPTASKRNLTWSISRDGVHWLPYNEQRSIATNRVFATSPSIVSDGAGNISSTQSVRVLFAAGNDPTIASGFYNWTIGETDIQIGFEPARGATEGVSAANVLTGWAYDPDTAVNDAAANGEISQPLGFDSPVQVVVINTANGQSYTIIVARFARRFRAQNLSARVTCRISIMVSPLI